MILNALLLIFGGFMAGLLAILSIAPNVAPPEIIQSSMTTLAPLISSLGVVFPLPTLFALIGVDIFGVEIPYFTYKGIRWIYRKIPGVS